MAKMVKNPELVAMDTISKILNELSVEAKSRVLGWVNAEQGKSYEDTATGLFDGILNYAPATK